MEKKEQIKFAHSVVSNEYVFFYKDHLIKNAFYSNFHYSELPNIES